MPPTDKPVMFGPKPAQRISDAVKRIEAQPYYFPSQPNVYPRLSGTSLQVVEGIVTNTITAFNSNTNTYGQGYVQPYQPGFNSNTNSYHLISDSSFNGNSTSLCLNFYVNNGAAINTNTHVYMCQRSTNAGALIFELVGADC